MPKPSPGLRKRGQIWHIEKIVAGQRLYESTGESDLAAAEVYLAKRIAEIRRVKVYGERPAYTFDQAAAKYLEDHAHKKSLDRDINSLDAVMPYIGTAVLGEIHAGTLEPYLKDRQAAGIQAGTLTRDLAVVRRILTLAARLWRDDQGRPWLDTVPMLPAVRGTQRKPRPITHEEQARLFKELPGYLAEMALFAVNTGMRSEEICGLRWEWEYQVEGLEATVFVLPETATKNGKERIVPLNAVARSIVESKRGEAGDYVFTFKGQRISRMTNKAWIKGRKQAGLEMVRVHDLRHTFGMRLRAACVGLEDRQDLLGHYAGRITTHYSRADIARLIECYNNTIPHYKSMT